MAPHGRPPGHYTARPHMCELHKSCQNVKNLHTCYHECHTGEARECPTSCLPFFIQMSNGLLLEWRDLCQDRVVTVAMQDRQTVAHGARSDEAIDGRPDSPPLPPGCSVNIHCYLENGAAERRFDHWKRKHRFTGQAESSFVAKSLQYFLNHREAGNNLVEVDNLLQAQRISATKGLDPD